MGIVQIFQIIAVVCSLLFFTLNVVIAINTRYFRKSGRVALMWSGLYMLYLSIVRLVSYLGIASIDELRVITAFSSLIPLLSTLIHLFVIKPVVETKR